ncbi:MAG: MFS transporter [Verrucomicrobia bacterium]|nr:MFS transporter [Verrucomicrobiota bacterium]
MSDSPTKIGYQRWIVCALLFFAATINYIDRQVIGLLKPELEKAFQWDERTYAGIVFSFQFAYAIGMLLSGRIIDRIGIKKGFIIFVGLWSLAAIGHGFAHRLPDFSLPWMQIDAKTGFAFVTLTGTAAGFALMRFLLGLGEAGNFPASIKATAEWFPKKERALATGIFNSGTNVGALGAPLLVPWIAVTLGWEWAFIITGAVGFLWMAWWAVAYYAPRQHPRITPAEVAHIESDPPDEQGSVSWLSLLRFRQTWAVAVGKFLTDPVWWLYLFWIPGFLNKQHGVDLKNIGLPLVTIYLIADVGSIGGGWISSRLIKAGWTVNAARKTAMGVCAVSVIPIVFVNDVGMWPSVLLVSLAAAAHQGWSCNMFTLASDMFPRKAVGSVVGIGGMSGAVGGMVLAFVVGEVLQRTGSYAILWFIAGSAYLIGLAIIHLLVPRMEPVRMDEIAAAEAR